MVRKAHEAAVISTEYSHISNYCYSIGGDEHHILKV